MREANGLFGRVFGEPVTYSERVPPDAWLKDLLAKDDFIALVARSEGKVVGAITAYVLVKFEQARREVYIYDLAVAEDRRREGIATALIERVRRISRDLGAWVIFVQADHGDCPAIALYQKLGLREDVLHFDIQP
jgi:aminoglycoside 3-N-acetyltransferase I